MKKALKVILIVLVLIVLIAWKLHSDGTHSRRVAAQEGDGVVVSEAIETIPGFTESRITPAAIAALEQHLVADAESKAKIRAREEGVHIDSVGFTASSFRFNQNGERAVITELHTPKKVEGGRPISVKVIWWVQNEQVKRVFCVALATEDLNYRRGKCGRQVAKTFGYKRWYME